MGVQIFRIIREKLGWTRYKMAKELGISQTQYDYLEKKAVNAATKTLIKLQEVSDRELLMPLEEYWGLLKRKK